MKKYLLRIEFRYEDKPYKSYLTTVTRTITIGIYDTIDEAINEGNKAIEELSNYFEVRYDDKFCKNHIFGQPKFLVTNCPYPTKGISYFARISPLNFQSLTDTIHETFKARERYEKYLTELDMED